ncbi:hypothetical protein FUMI01_18070 [Flavobacterium sp. UMI-01]|nr:hypothetical protein FUMI01_18070 [Flavobacterium sp. UMI-01]
MLSSQGSTTTLTDGMIICQTIGQQTVSGTSKKGPIVLQGFQQYNWSKLIAGSSSTNNITVKAFPNPFIKNVSFQFSTSIEEEISITIFDISGHLIFEKKKKPIDKIIQLDLESLPGAIFLIRLSNSELNFYAKIIKTL